MRERCDPRGLKLDDFSVATVFSEMDLHYIF